MNLSKQERLMLYNQYDILEKLNPSDSETYRIFKSILSSGYKLHYSDMVQWFSDEMSEEASTFVLDVLDMYSALLNSYQNLEDKTGIEERRVTFPGFDGNNESTYLGYTRFFLHDLDRYNELHQKGHDSYNSHSRMVPKYSRMLGVWKEIESERRFDKLSKEEINETIDA